MPPSPAHEIQLSLEEFDRSKLPADQQGLQGEAFQQAVQDHLAQEFAGGEGGAAQVVVTDDRIFIRWEESDEARSFSQRGIEALKQGDYDRGTRFLTEALKRNPADADALFNLGMAMSDQGRLDEAIAHLERLLVITPQAVHGWVAMGVAHARKGDFSLAIKALQNAVFHGPNDGYARRTLGAVMAQAGQDPEKAVEHLRAASRLLPDDPETWHNLGRVLEQLGELDEADRAYLKVIDLTPAGQTRELAERGRSRIAEASFRSAGKIRPDAFAYCLDALATFEGLPTPEVQKITFEIAMLGTKGLDVNNPAQKYTLRSMPGNFSGLRLLCIEYVGFQILDPKADIGFDLSKEYREALAIHRGKSR